jgi:LPS-assembly protein
MRRLLAAGLLLAGASLAQPSLDFGGRGVSRDQPVAFQADQVDYDRDRAVVTARGAVQAWQGDRILLADEVSFNRNTRRMTARGNVILVEPDGQVLFAETADLTDDLRDGVLTGLRGLLAQNGRFAAPGARRTEGRLTEMARAVYSTCEPCAEDPLSPPIWQLRARSAVHDGDARIIEYTDVSVEAFGVPVFYFPYFYHPDPTVRRQSGLLAPEFGVTNRLGAFLRIPYYWVIDEQSDATITPLFATANLPQLGLEYRRRFNSGTLRLDLSGTYDNDEELRGHAFITGSFAVNETWRWGFDLRRASDESYLRQYRVQGVSTVTTTTLPSSVFAEGFGQGSYARIDTRFYQAVRQADDAALLPFVLPSMSYDYQGVPDRWGGRPYFDLGFFNILREDGTDTTRGATRLGWQLPGQGLIGDLWRLTLQTDALAYAARDLDRSPNFLARSRNEEVRVHPQAAIEWRLPLVRVGQDGLGRQVIEPIVQVVTAPRISNRRAIPNEDSLELEFSDANLFSLNRWPGRDRLEGGTRVNYAMRGAWYFQNGFTVDGLVGASTRDRRGDFPRGSGLEDRQSDIVGRLSVQPVPLVDLTYRARFDRRNGAQRQTDIIASAGPPLFRVSGGYLAADPVDLPRQRTRREEIAVGASTAVGPWRLSGFHRADVETGKPTGTLIAATYEDECVIFDVRLSRRFTRVDGERPETAVVFRVVLKTVGEFGFSAL